MPAKQARLEIASFLPEEVQSELDDAKRAAVEQTYNYLEINDTILVIHRW